MVDTLTQVPGSLVAGDTFAWQRDLSVDYPASTWALIYYLDREGKRYTINATASGDVHVVSVAGSETASYEPGRYRWHARVNDGTTFKTIESGWIEITPNPADNKTKDWRSHARRMLEAIEAVLEKQASQDQLDLVSYAIGGSVNVSRDRKILIELRSKYRAEVQDEEPASGRSTSRHIYLRFGAP